MARAKPKPPRPSPGPGPQPAPAPPPPPPGSPFWTTKRQVLAVVLLLTIQATLAVRSLVRENPTIDEVAHLPAGVSYWKSGSFRMYPHNPPLVKLIAALPAIASGATMDRIFDLPSWRAEPPMHPSIAHEFAIDNVGRYFEMFERSRLIMPLFATVGGIVVFLWSRWLWGPWGAVLSLALWSFCPHILAHTRLVTTDVGATSLGLLATYLFARFLDRPTWSRAAWGGLGLGLALLAKFSNLVLLPIWPVLWLIAEVRQPNQGRVRRIRLGVEQGALVLAIAVLVINLGYHFEGTGRRLGSFEFTCGTLTRPRLPSEPVPRATNDLLGLAWTHRINRYRGTWLGALLVPLPRYFVTGFDLQKLEAEGIPKRFLDPRAPEGEAISYPVYLDGQLRDRGWWYYYLAALAYKVPEGTWVLGLLALGVLAVVPRARSVLVHEATLAAVPLAVMAAMSFGTDINLGLRYILPAFPFVFIGIGRLGPWAAGAAGLSCKRLAAAVVGVPLALTIAATFAAHPSYLAYFNWASGGTAHGSEHLIDSNLDWGQDLVNLRDWLAVNAPGQKVGLAYFGQINPVLLQHREEGFPWFLPPAAGVLPPAGPVLPTEGAVPRIVPGLYAVSASFVRGLPYSIYDPSPLVPNLYPAWDSRKMARTSPYGAFGYFRLLEPVARLGGSIYVYRVDSTDAETLNRLLDAQK